MFASLAISAMALSVAWVLDALGPLGSVDAALDARLSMLSLGDGLQAVDAAWVWAWAVLVTVGVAWAVLHVRTSWQRLVIVVSALVLTAAWIPVLALMDRAPHPAVPVVALLWVSVGSMIYAARHSVPR